MHLFPISHLIPLFPRNSPAEESGGGGGWLERMRSRLSVAMGRRGRRLRRKAGWVLPRHSRCQALANLVAAASQRYIRYRPKRWKMKNILIPAI